MTAWLWPIGLGGRMPVGGDVTQFSLGLMAVLGRSLRAGALPYWNDLWGFGFPGLAESQMGVYYPPHLVLYRFLPVEMAYTTSLVLHTYFAALGAYWMARQFGVSPWGSALAGWSWSASGMFVIHLSHQWGYTVGCWMPWALGLGWTIRTAERKLARGCLLAAVLALQVLPGHFQFAFQTQALLGLLGLGMLFAGRRGVRPALTIFGAIAAVLPLSAAQLWPTWELARSAQSQRTYDYLSAFASPPSHLTSYVAPNFFHLSPLWRPLAWDPFHAMPEEHRPYLGLVPLMLALGAIRRGARSDRGTRTLTILGLAATLLSFGPYLPGFSLLIRLPGFSFFRAPARWSLPAELMLAILAGQGFDAWRSWPHMGRATIRFAAACALLSALLVGITELAFLSTERPGLPVVANLFEKARSLLPWPNDPSFQRFMAATRRPTRDPLIVTGLLSEGVEPERIGRITLAGERRAIYGRELAETATLIGLVLLIAIPLSRRWKGSEALLLLLAFGDLMLLGRHRAIGTAPIRPLIEQSPILAMMAKLPAGSRTIDPFRNLPMMAGAAPVSAYRTLDRPAMTGLIATAAVPLDGSVAPDMIRQAMRALGVSIRVLDPLEPGDGEPIRDPALASWLYGAWGDQAPPFRVWRPGPPLPLAFSLPDDANESSDARPILEALRKAEPLEFTAIRPGEFTVRGAVRSPGTVVISVLDDPHWRTFDERNGASLIERSHAPIDPTSGGGSWMEIDNDGGRPIRLRCVYDVSTAIAARWASIGAWAAWLLVMGISRAADARRKAPG